MKTCKRIALFLILAAFLTVTGCCIIPRGHGPCGCKKACATDAQKPCPMTADCTGPGCVKQPAAPVPAPAQ